MAALTYTGGGGRGVRGQQNVCVSKSDLQLRVPVASFFFFRRNSFLMWVVGRVGQAEEPRLPFRPPPPFPRVTPTRCTVMPPDKGHQTEGDDSRGAGAARA